MYRYVDKSHLSDYNGRSQGVGVWGRAPSGVQSRALGQGVRGRSPLKADPLLVLDVQ